MIESFSDTVRDAPIEKRFLVDVRPVVIAIRLPARALRTTNTGGRIKSKRIAIVDSARIFAADSLGTETIAEGSFGK
jgi:hypothetical protein